MDGSSVRSETNLVLLSPGFADGEQDTTSMPALQLYAGTLAEQHPEIKVHIVTTQFPFKKGNYLWHGIPVYSAGGKNGKWNRLMTWARVLRHLYGLRRRGHVDLIHAFWLTEASFIAMFFRLLTGTPALTTAMGQDVKRNNRYLPILNLFGPRTVLISEFQRAFLEHRKGIRIANTIPFGIDPPYYTELPAERPTDILAVGSLNRIKNYPEFLEVVKRITEEFPAVRCRILGEGLERDGLELHIRGLGLEKNVTLAGNTDYAKVQNEMCRAKILLHTSRFEGQGMVLTEGLAAGMYVVSHPVGIAFSLRSTALLTGVTTIELADHVRSVLRLEHPDHISRVFIKITDTCREYVILYRSLLLRNEI
jgi:glycosyltransferase involved in cell wall biosynthesis